MNEPTLNQVLPEKTPMYIGPGVVFEGTIRHEGPQDERAVIVGEFHGDIEWNGVLQVISGAKVVVQNKLQARQMVVAGEVTGKDESVTVETGLLRMSSTAVVDVGTLNLPTGGLEQDRGSVVNARLKMSAEHLYAEESAVPTPTAPVKPALAIISGAGSTSTLGSTPGSALAQVETRDQLAGGM